MPSEFGKIEKNIDPPKCGDHRGIYGHVRIAHELSPGDSVLLETLNQARAFCTILRVSGKKATYRSVDGGFRVWRLKDDNGTLG